jgi:hypothetical protein
MKIHSDKIKEDFASYFADLQKTLPDNLKKHKENSELIENSTIRIFKEVYPLFVLLETLYSPAYFVDPSKQIELDQCIKNGDKEKIISAKRALDRTKISDDLKKGLEDQFFTPYLNELYSDAFLLSNQYYLNNYRGCYLYLRCILEDLYKHIYYIDHKQEFHRVCSGMSEYELGITPQFLREYLEHASPLCDLRAFNSNFEKILKETDKQNKETIFNLNENLYRKTSAFVHPSDPAHMSHFQSNSDLVFEAERAKEVLEITREVVSIVIVFLICIHFQQFTQFNDFEKSLVIMRFNNSRKGNLRKALGI